MFEIVLLIIGVIASALYVGYLAYAIGAVPLWIIVVATYALAIYEFVMEYRGTDDPGSRNGANR